MSDVCSDENKKREVSGDKKKDCSDVKIGCNCFAEFHRDCPDCLFYKVCSAVNKLQILSVE